MEKIKELLDKEFMDALKSKKFWVLIVGIAVIMVGSAYSVNDMALQLVAGLLASYQVGQGIADNGKEKVKEERRRGY